MGKTFIAALAALALSGCAMVTSDKPLFAPADAAGAAVLTGISLGCGCFPSLLFVRDRHSTKSPGSLSAG